MSEEKGQVIKMEKNFEGKKILSRMTARLVPPDSTYPDAMCDVIMTEDIFCAMEDNYDDTFTYHLNIPLERIISVSKYKSERPEEIEKDKYAPGQATAAIMALAGVIYIPGKGRKKAIKTYLKVVYKNKEDKTQTVFFEECSNIKSMINAWSGS